MEFAVVERGEEEGWRDVGLRDEVAEVGRHDACFVLILGVGLFGIGVWGVGFPFFEDGAQFVFAAEEADALAAVAHAGFEDPPFFVLRVGGEGGVSREAFVELVGFDEGFVEEFGVVELEVWGWFYVVFEDAGRVFGEPGGDGVGEPVFPDEGFADDIGVCEGGMGMGHQVVEVEGFVGSYLEEASLWGGEVRW